MRRLEALHYARAVRDSSSDAVKKKPKKKHKNNETKKNDMECYVTEDSAPPRRGGASFSCQTPTAPHARHQPRQPAA
jgi:hypothetical protein